MNADINASPPVFRAGGEACQKRHRHFCNVGIWTEETGFSHLTHAVGLADAPRTRDLGRAAQELWGRLVLYDACSLGTAGVPEPAPGPRRPRATDRAPAFKAFLRMLRSLVGRVAFDVEACAARMSHSVRRGRSHERRKRPKSSPRSQYRH